MKERLKDPKVLATLLMIIFAILLYINPKIVLLTVAIVVLVCIWNLLVILIKIIKRIKHINE